MQNVIENQNGQFKSATGPAAVNAFRLRTLVAMLNSEIRAKAAGVTIPLFKVSVLKAAKRITGLKTNDRATHVAKLTLMLAETLEQVEVVDTTKPNDKSEAYHTGYEAAKQGEPQDSFTGIYQSWDHIQWLQGWKAAQE